MKVFIKTYGCQANIADSEAMAGLLQKEGHEIVDHEKDAEKIIINSCSVKNKTQAKEMHYARKWSSEKEVFVGGCLTKTIDVKKFAPNVIAVFDTNSLTKVAEVLEKKKDIAILWDMGASMQLLRRLFLMEGILITLIGALLGIILGLVVCWLQIHFGLLRFNEGFIVDAYPIKMQLNDFIAVFGVVMLIGLFAAWYPVRVFTKKYMRSYKQLV